MPTSAAKTIAPDAKTDVQYQEIKLFIEGVQVPFLSIVVNSALGQLPNANISVPPQVGLMDISRYYNPKVHVFFVDPNDLIEKVLFSGIITSSSLNKTADGSSAISFTCAHRYQFLTELLMDFSDWVSQGPNSNQEDHSVKVASLNSKYAVGLAMTGVFKDQSVVSGKKEVTLANMATAVKDVSPAVLPTYLTDYKNRLVGTPGILLNLWNQLKQGVFNPLIAPESDVMTKLYIPLLEQGLQFFQRMSGHYFIEDKIEADRIDGCTDTGAPDGNNKPKIVCPNSRAFMRSSAQVAMAEEQVQSSLQFSGELVDLLTIYTKFLSTLDYELLFLSSPAEVPKDPTLDKLGNFVGNVSDTFGTDVIIKPQLPFYFSPVCNIVLPSMVRNLVVQQEDFSVPTRIVIKDSVALGSAKDGFTKTFYRGPASIREAVALFGGTVQKVVQPNEDTDVIQPGTRNVIKVSAGQATVIDVPRQSLRETLTTSHGKIGKFEFGRGVRPDKMDMPRWLKFFNLAQSRAVDGQLQTASPADTAAVDALKRGWIRRYGMENVNLNPWDTASNLSAHERILISSADYYYAMSVAKSRAGQIDTIFNPYIVVGYPMDILDSTPNHPSFHAYCTSVTHSITANSINTTVSFTSAMTYTELANYYTAPVHPWLLYTLGLAESQSIVSYRPSDSITTPSAAGEFGTDDPTNPDAAGIAHRFYKTTLGVGAAVPTDIYNFDTGEVLPVARVDVGLKPGQVNSTRGNNQGELNPNLSGVGNLSLVRRNIETREQVESRWDVKFIDLTPGHYNSNAIRISDKVLADRDKLELGESIWLDYDDDGGVQGP